jgi:hypothetical protein
MVKQMLSVKIDANVCQQLRSEVGKGNISGFVERAVAKELRNYDNRLEREQKEFQQKLIAGYKRSARSKALKKEDEIWDEVVGEGIE